MAIVLKDRVKETTATTGTADFTLAGAVGGFQAFSAIGNGNFTYYAAVDNTTGDWEIGYGQYSTTGPTLTRTTILASSAAGAKISFASGPKDVFLTYPAGKSIYEEESGNVLIDGGPITVIGQGVTGYTTFSAALGELYANIDSFAQMYAQNYNGGANASGDFVVYRNDAVDDTGKFVDMGINSSNYSSVDYPIFSAGSAYLFNDGGELFVGSATDDVVIFAGGVDTTDEAVRIDKTTKSVTTTADVNVGGAVDVTGAATFGSTVLLNADPTLPLQASTKQYVDNAVSTGLHLHQPVLVATTGNLTAAYNNGSSGVGATLTNSSTQVALAIDGVNMTVADRVLVWQQSAAAQNGIYVVTTVGSGATNWVLTRASDADTYVPQSDTGLGGGDYFYVQSGTTGSGDSYVCTNDGTITFGTTAITFAQFSGAITYVGGTNIDVSGQTISLTGTVAPTNGGTGVNTVTTGDLLYGSASNTWSKLPAGSAYRSLVMNAGGTQVEWNAVALNQSGAVSGSLPATNGGTGQASYAVGDTLYSGTTNTLDKLAGNTTTTKKFLGQTGTGSASQAPVWQQPAASDITGLAPSATTDTTNAANITSGTLPSARLNGGYTGITGVGTLTAGTWNGSTVAAAYGGTGTSSYAVGDLLYADTTTSLAKLADVATGNALIAGGVGVAPSWGKIGLATHVSGTLPVANGGTNGSAVPTAGAVAFGTGTAYNFNSAGTLGQLLTSAGAGTPTWTAQSALSVGTATNIAGGAANQVHYQSASGTTAFVTAPTTAGQALTWNGTAFIWQTAGAATLQNDTSTNSTFYPTFATSTTGAFTDARVSSTKLTFNPNTGLLTTTGLSTSSLTTSGLTMNGTLLFSNATSPNSYTVQFGDNTGWNLRFMTSVSGTPTTRFTFGDNGNFTAVGSVTGTTHQGTVFQASGNGIYALGQIRATGWWNTPTGSSYSGLATEIGVSSGQGYIYCYNRDTSAYGPLNLGGSASNLVISGGTVNVTAGALQQGGSQVLTAGNYTSYVNRITDEGGSGAYLKLNATNELEYFNSAGTIQTLYINYSGGSTSLCGPGGGILVSSTNSTRSNWNSNFGTAVVAGQLAWKNYGNNHTIFDASASTSPDGTSVNNTNSAVAWSGSYPTLMGWNGSSTYGVRVDSARVSDNTTGSSTSCSGTAYLATAVQFQPNRTDSAPYQVLWGAAYTSGSGTIAYSCAAVTITSSSGTLTATTVTASSDETLKTNWRGYAPDFVEQLAKVKHGTYDRLDCEVTQDGASAQSLLKVLPKSVWEDTETKKLSINYGGASMVSAIQLAKRVVEQDARIAKLESLLAKLTP